jgi:hypothetical protein
MNKEEFEQAVGELYVRCKERDAALGAIELLKPKLLAYMVEHDIPNVNSHDFLLLKQFYKERRQMSAVELRSILGKDAEKFISEVVSAKCKELLTKEQIDKYYKVTNTEPYVSMTIKGDPEQESVRMPKL